MARPCGLDLLKDRVNTGDTSQVQDLRVQDFVPPPDVYRSEEAAKVKMVELFGVSAVESPSHRHGGGW